MNPTAIGVDIGGSHIACAAIDLSTHRIIPGTGSSRKIDNKAGAGEILDGWSHAIAGTMAVIDKKSLAGIGFAMPGPFDYPKGIALFERVEKYESLFGVNVSEQLRQRLDLDADVPLRYINDATAFAIAEAWVGKAGSFDKMIALTLGTGFGSAFINKGIPVLTGETVPEMGCVWHIPFREGIADDYFSTRGLLNRYKEKTGTQLSGVKELSQLAARNPVALSLFEDFGSKLGLFLQPLMVKFGAEILVIGGNISNAFPLFGESLRSHLQSNSAAIRIEVSELRDTASMIGSAVLVDNTYFDHVKSLLPEMS